MPKSRPRLILGICQRKAEEREQKELWSERRAIQRPRGRRLLGLECSFVILSAESQGMSPPNHPSHDLVKGHTFKLQHLHLNDTLPLQSTHPQLYPTFYVFPFLD